MNRFSLFFLAFLLTVAFFLSLQSVSSFIHYKTHSIPLEGKMSQWKISETANQKFIIIVFYTYVFQEKLIKAKTVFPQKFMNSELALDALKDFSKRKWTVWVKASGKEPVLDKKFPFKKMFQSILSIGVFFYFLFFKKIYQT